MEAEPLMRQALMTAHTYLNAAIRDIDQAFTPGYARAHPELVGAMMQTAALDFMAMWSAQEIASQLVDLTSGVNDVAAQLEYLAHQSELGTTALKSLADHQTTPPHRLTRAAA